MPKGEMNDRDRKKDKKNKNNNIYSSKHIRIKLENNKYKDKSVCDKK